MKKLNLCWMLIALMGIFASCSKDDLQNAATGSGGEGMTFTVGTDFGAQTRVTAPSIPEGRKLRYVMEVYVRDPGTGNYLKSGSQSIKYVSNASEQVSFAVPKQTQKYKCVFWADFYDGTNPSNNAFNTDDLTNVTTLQDKPTEAYEAFYAVTAEIEPTGTTTQNITLKHAVAKVSLLTTSTIKDCKYAKISYGGGTAFNAMTGEVNASRTETFGVRIDNTAATVDKPYTLHYFYFFAPKDKQLLVTVSGTLHESADKTTDIIRSFKVANVPLQSNYVTNLKGAFGVETGISLTVSCDADWSATPNEPLVWDGTLPAEDLSYTYSGGNGTEPAPYEIGNLKDLVQFAANLSGNYSSDYFKLTADIDLADKPWPALYAPKCFDGDGHTIRGLYATYSSNDGTGFFYGGDGSTIKNLHVKGIVIDGESYTGGILGWDETGSCIITGCSFEGTVSGSQHVGGIAGSAYQVTGCKFMGEVIYNGIGGQQQDDAHGVGGIVGRHVGMSQDNLTITACYNTGTIIVNPKAAASSWLSVGGITGSYYTANYSATSIVKACYNTGTMELNGSMGKNDDISGWRGTGYTGRPAFIAIDNTTQYFEQYTWPLNTGDWGYDYYADGTGAGQYWKSLGGWNNGSPVYPILWWEK